MFTIEEIEQMDIRQFNYFKNKIVEDEKKKRIMFKLDLSECINFAYIGSQYDSSGKNKYAYKNWREQLCRLLDPEFYTRQGKMFWDNLAKGKSKMFGTGKKPQKKGFLKKVFGKKG